MRMLCLRILSVWYVLYAKGEVSQVIPVAVVVSFAACVT